jgi:hypothetical protein
MSAGQLGIVIEEGKIRFGLPRLKIPTLQSILGGFGVYVKEFSLDKKFGCI